MKRIIGRLIPLIVTNFPRFWAFIRNQPFLNKITNRFFINRLVKSTTPRPHPFSLWSEDPAVVSDYTAWPSLTQRVFTARHLPPAPPDYVASLPDTHAVAELFRRQHEILSSRSTVMFMFFAQWFTDSFLRTDPNDLRKNTSNHEIDLCQIYGLNEHTTKVLRAYELGKLKSQTINGEEYPPYLYDTNGAVNPEFAAYPHLGAIQHLLSRFEKGILKGELAAERRRKLFASGLERGNFFVGYSALNTLFLREHNRVCTVLHQKHPQWNDERLFQTARNILIVILLKIVIEDYINHISPALFPFQVEHGFAETQRWYRTNWITVEFDLLYRWHGLVTNTIEVGGAHRDEKEYMYNNPLLEQVGIGGIFNSASAQTAGRIGLSNTPDFLLKTELASLDLSRKARVKPYNDYLECFGSPRLRSFEELTQNLAIQDVLKQLYGSVDRIEFYTGLLAQDRLGPRAVLMPLLTIMVGVDAFSHALTNPLLSINVFNESTFSKVGLDIINETSTLRELVARNVSGDVGNVSFNIPGTASPVVLRRA
jgi:prostaglandin-endoperoxide synthase 2